MKVLVTGASGMLGREVVKAAIDADPRSSEIAAFSHQELDITDRDQVRFVLDALGTQVVINCAGLTKHRDPEPIREEYHRVNTYGPLVLATECDRIGARMIHVSTDCVFSGERPIEEGPYTEADLPDATDPYGWSKSQGEIHGAPHLTVRCSFVGDGERGLIAWLRTKTAIDRVERWYNVHWSGSTAPAIARALIELAGKREVTGLMHLAGEHVTKGHLINLIWSNGLAPEATPVAMADTPFLNRWLDTTRTDVPALPPLHDALRELRQKPDDEGMPPMIGGDRGPAGW